MIRKLNVDGRTIEYELTRKRVKNINMRITADSTVSVSANSRTTIEMIENALIRNADYIFKTQDRLKTARASAPQPLRYEDNERVRIFDRDYIIKILPGSNTVFCDSEWLMLFVKDARDKELKEKLCENYLRQLVSERLTKWLAEIYPLFSKHNIPYPEIKFRRMKARWGSCHSNKGKIIFNTELVHKSEAFCRYVIVHELAHFVQPNHSADFYKVVAEIMPDYKEIIKKG